MLHVVLLHVVLLHIVVLHVILFCGFLALLVLFHLVVLHGIVLGIVFLHVVLFHLILGKGSHRCHQGTRQRQTAKNLFHVFSLIACRSCQQVLTCGSVT